MSAENDDLGLERPIKLGHTLRIPKLTDELLFDNIRGLPQIRNNYSRLSKALKRNTKKYAEKLASSKAAAHQAKVACESENLQKVLLFYQLWCHELFPRATFHDCLKMLRAYKSSTLKNYRRELLDNEIRRLKIEQGIIVEGQEDAHPQNELYESNPQSPGIGEDEQADPNHDDSDEEDWGFLSVKRRNTNGLFIGEDDEDDDVAPAVPRPSNEVPSEAVDNFNDFDEEQLNDFDEAQLLSHQQPDDDKYDEELAIMREMGM